MASSPVQESDLSGFVRALTPRLTAKIKEGQGLETADDRFKMPVFFPPNLSVPNAYIHLQNPLPARAARDCVPRRPPAPDGGGVARQERLRRQEEQGGRKRRFPGGGFRARAHAVLRGGQIRPGRYGNFLLLFRYEMGEYTYFYQVSLVGEEIAFSAANRSAALFQLRRFEECLQVRVVSQILFFHRFSQRFEFVRRTPSWR